MAASASTSVDEYVPAVGAPAKITRRAMTGPAPEPPISRWQFCGGSCPQRTMTGIDEYVPLSASLKTIVPIGPTRSGSGAEASPHAASASVVTVTVSRLAAWRFVDIG